MVSLTLVHARRVSASCIKAFLTLGANALAEMVSRAFFLAALSTANGNRTFSAYFTVVSAFDFHKGYVVVFVARRQNENRNHCQK
jgi:hypothetical protein